MGFPNVDLILQGIFLDEFARLKNAPEAQIADLFEDRSEEQQAEIASFIYSRAFTGDVRDRGRDKRVFILPHFPSVDLPFPQIGIYSGDVEANDRALGDYMGEAQPVTENGQIVAWEQNFGYWEMASWNIDVVAATKEETIWLARFCQYFICQNFTELNRKGIVEVGITMTDLRLEKATLQPLQYFARGIKIHAKTANSWKKKLPVGYYQTGENIAVTGEKQ